MSKLQTVYQVIVTYFLEVIFPYFRDQVYPRFLEIIKAPLSDLDSLWIIAPVIISMILIQLYFGRHKDEELGWNTAYANSIVLIFVSLGLLHHIFNTFNYQEIFSFIGSPFYKTVLAALVLLYAILLLFIDFTHSLHKKLAFFLSSSITIGVTAFVSIVLIRSEVPFDLVTLTTAICIFLVALIFFKIFRWIIPPTREAERFLERQKEKKEEIKKEKKLEEYRKIRRIEENIKEEIGTFTRKAEDSWDSLKNIFKKH